MNIMDIFNKECETLYSERDNVERAIMNNICLTGSVFDTPVDYELYCEHLVLATKIEELENFSISATVVSSYTDGMTVYETPGIYLQILYTDPLTGLLRKLQEPIIPPVHSGHNRKEGI